MGKDSERHIRPWIRVTILLGSLGVGSLVAYLLTGELLPTDPQDALVFQTALLLLVLGSAIVEHKFTKPADALVNSLMGLLTLAPVYRIAPTAGWWAIFSFTAIIFTTAAVCVAVSEGPIEEGWQATVARVTFKFATFFGRARLYFSVLLLFGLWAFYSIRDPRLAILVVFWGLYLAIWPLGLPAALSAFSTRNREPTRIGVVLRTDSPNILRIQIQPQTAMSWQPERPMLCRQVDGTTGWVLPLYAEQQAEQLVGTGLFVPARLTGDFSPALGGIYLPKPEERPDPLAIAKALGVPEGSRMIGFVVEDSDIGTIRFETWEQSFCQEGALVWVTSSTGPVYYQILNGMTREESSEANRRGYQIAIAAQVGRADADRGFLKYPWLPRMNAPVFGVPTSFGRNLFAPANGDFPLGTIPGTEIRARLSIRDAISHHLAILGVTGAGKTELAFDLIRHAVGIGTKVVCVDLTARYAGRLGDLTPRQLSVDETVAKELSEKLFAVETGQYKASDEKKALEKFSATLRADIAGTLQTFLETPDAANRVGIVTLPAISNTKATLYITELYLTLLLQYAKEKASDSPPILIVLEEAHTVIPEAMTMGLGDSESRGLVGKMAQIALQGRKYRVGLMVVAQRTATVSKTVLTQCNTIISFACIDDTSIGFLTNVYGSSFAHLLPNLPPLQAVVFGKALRSQRPLVVQIPFDAAKAARDG